MKIGKKVLTLLLSIIMVVTLFVIPTSASSPPPAITVDGVTVTARVDQLTGNQNRLWVTLTDSGGITTQDFMIRNNADGVYPIWTEAGDYTIFVDTKGNTQIRACYIVSFKERPTLPVLFENGQWAAELGDITVHTPGGDSTWAYEDGLIHIYNGVESRNIAFRFVFENTVDMRGYDSVVMELEEAPSGWFRGILRFIIDQDAGWGSNSHTNIIRMTKGTSSDGGPGTSAGNWDLERLRGVGGLPAYGESVRIKKIYLEGDGVFSPVTINSRNIMDIIPPRTGNTPVTSITTSSQYSGTVVWNPNHSTFQADTEYTATITLTPRRGWTLSGVPANWFRIYNPTGTNNAAIQVTHEAGSGVLTRTFPATTAIVPYPEPTQFVALTYDDTFSSNTNALLDVIDQLGIKVTFFASGINLEKARTNPDLRRAVDRMIAGGHEIGNHAWQHERWDNNADIDVMRADFKRNQDLIREFTGKNPQWIRIPYASHSSNSLMVAGEFGLSNLRGLATDDWNIHNSVSFLVNRILTSTGNNRLTDGQIYVSHDQPGQTNTMQALPEIVHELRSRGFGFMTVSELRAHRNFPVSPGVNYPNFFH